jgi:hypothetical protein
VRRLHAERPKINLKKKDRYEEGTTHVFVKELGVGTGGVGGR